MKQVMLRRLMRIPILKILQGKIVLRKVIGNAFWQVSDKTLRLILGLAVATWMARYLGPKDFGSLNFATAFAALFGPIADVGLQAVVVRELVRRPMERARILIGALVIRIVGAGAAIVLSSLFIFILRPIDLEARVLVLVISLSLLPQAWDVIDFDYQARIQSRPIVVIRSVSLIVFSSIKVWLIIKGAGLIWFAWTIIGEAFLSAVLMAWLSRLLSFSFFNISETAVFEIKRLLRYSWPLAFSNLSVVFYMRIDQVMLGQLSGDQAVGIFSAAVRVSESWYFVPMAILAAVAPALTKTYDSSQEQYRRKLLLFIRLVCWLGLIAGLVLTLASNRIIQLLYGPHYSQASAVLAIHAWAGVFACLGIGSVPWFVNAGIVKLKMMYTVAGAACNVALNLYSIPRFGAVGAAISTLISYAVSGFLINVASRQSRPVFFLQLRSLFISR
jgi:polysaccharide transporter, PST family